VTAYARDQMRYTDRAARTPVVVRRLTKASPSKVLKAPCRDNTRVCAERQLAERRKPLTGEGALRASHVRLERADEPAVQDTTSRLKFTFGVVGLQVRDWAQLEDFVSRPSQNSGSIVRLALGLPEDDDARVET
jgi:hypothetical protein